MSPFHKGDSNNTSVLAAGQAVQVVEFVEVSVLSVSSKGLADRLADPPSE